MKIKFYLKRPKSKSATTIYALVNFNANTIKIYTGESIVPKFWNADTNSARCTEKFAEHPQFNERLNQIRSSINMTYLDFKNRNDNREPQPDELKTLLLKIFDSGKAKDVSFLEYFEKFERKTSLGERMNPKSKKPIATSGGRGYFTTLTHLKEFAKTWDRNLDFNTIDLQFHSDFTEYLSSKELLSANTIGSHFQRIKAVMSDATDRGLNTNLIFKSRLFVKQSEESDSIYLNESELDEMHKLDLSNNSKLDNARDLFLVGCFTCQRYSDFSKLTEKNIKDGFITLTQQKTGATVVIPLHRILKAILNKYNGGFPRTISNEKLNEYLKEIGQLMPSLKKVETKTITKGGVVVTKNIEKWKLLVSHTARRSFCTNEYLAGTPTITIMALSGHKTEKSFMSYIKCTPHEHANKIAELWNKRENKLKVV